MSIVARLDLHFDEGAHGDDPNGSIILKECSLLLKKQSELWSCALLER